MSNVFRSYQGGASVQPTGNATVADVLAGKTFSNSSAVGLEGTMTNNGAVSGVATPSNPYVIPAGYHNGSGEVSANLGNMSIIKAAGISSSDASLNIVDIVNGTPDVVFKKIADISGSSRAYTFHFGNVYYDNAKYYITLTSDCKVDGVAQQSGYSFDYAYDQSPVVQHVFTD